MKSVLDAVAYICITLDAKLTVLDFLESQLADIRWWIRDRRRSCSVDGVALELRNGLLLSRCEHNAWKRGVKVARRSGRKVAIHLASS